MLDADDKAWIRETIAEILGVKGAEEGLPRLTCEQFAVAVQHNVDVVREKIRTGDIPARYVFGLRPKFILPRALEKFGVTQQEARERLLARNLLPAPQPSPASPSDTVSRPSR